MLKSKRDTKLHNLKQILQEFIKKKNKQKEQQRVLKRELQALPLDKRLEQLISEDSILTAALVCERKGIDAEDRETELRVEYNAAKAVETERGAQTTTQAQEPLQAPSIDQTHACHNRGGGKG
eukprot:CAMPEP_0185614146 /NCGR_PEP_ID=MMETSP0436-20130131/30369_1 /TAXON_ID=626734 ORGANISM="Favella taraikaensis, Strain Fe Narragansett Bay" /NCGR_SAMPLE_ID=MMETSP0436 /ASSEMBLY_ACC=CAM_ASM_000390 /LENGTH=122 /DNA_ID=CAMNT_0028248695 /DNA_START=331 /DNA_END=695 /DNA_ORIENTATION=-